MSVKSKLSSSKKEKFGRKEKKKKVEDSDEDFESSEEELDLTKECHSIGYYMNDRPEMINQMFSVIKGNKLKAMLPPILKDCDLEQLKLQCLDQLLGMSEKRITCILEGETLDTSSESEIEESDECDNDEINGTSSGSSSDRSEESQEENYRNNVDSKPRKRKCSSSNEGKLKLAKTESENRHPEQGKTLLEILELEMRARAIRALLKQSGIEKGGELTADETNTVDSNKNKVEEVADEVVDLTECEDEEFPNSSKKDVNKESEIYKKVSTFEEIVEKSKGEKSNLSQEDEKSKRLQAELELRNKLFKKKIYRTRQQRMENEEDDKTSKNETKSESIMTNFSNASVIKQEPIESEEKVIEDPEEGEIRTSEDECSMEFKKETSQDEIPQERELILDFESKMDEDSERITAIDNGTFISNTDVQNRAEDCESKNLNEEIVTLSASEEVTLEKTKTENSEVSGANNSEKEVNDLENNIEETSWRDRWLQKDGVQKLVKSSKIYAKVKKRIAEKSQKAKEEVLPPSEFNSDSNSNSKTEVVVEGSIEEYEKLSGKQSKETHCSENEAFLQTSSSKNGETGDIGEQEKQESPKNI